MVGINFTFSRSSLCLVLFSANGQDGSAPREVDGEACTPLVDDTCTPTYITLSDMTLSVMRSMSTSFIDSSKSNSS
jgi:hypothetical protein